MFTGFALNNDEVYDGVLWKAKLYSPVINLLFSFSVITTAQILTMVTKPIITWL